MYSFTSCAPACSDSGKPPEKRGLTSVIETRDPVRNETLHIADTASTGHSKDFGNHGTRAGMVYRFPHDRDACFCLVTDPEHHGDTARTVDEAVCREFSSFNLGLHHETWNYFGYRSNLFDRSAVESVSCSTTVSRFDDVFDILFKVVLPYILSQHRVRYRNTVMNQQFVEGKLVYATAEIVGVGYPHPSTDPLKTATRPGEAVQLLLHGDDQCGRTLIETYRSQLLNEVDIV